MGPIGFGGRFSEPTMASTRAHLVLRRSRASSFILLAGHGSITAAAALDAAIDLAEELERAPQLTMLLRGMRHTVVSAVAIAKF